MHNGRTANKAPISQHPAFSAIVALWFAALLGIGSLVLPVALFENLSLATGLSTVFSAATPPVGVAARILIALIGGGIGAVAGLYIARKVVAAQAASRRAPRETTASREAKRPISAHEELGAESFDEPVEDTRPALIPGRRRALSVTCESGPSELFDRAPLPGADTEIVLPAAAAFASEPAQADHDEALDLATFADREQPNESLEPAESREGFGIDHIVGPTVPRPDSMADHTRPFDSPEVAFSAEREPHGTEAPVDSLRDEIDFAAAPAPERFAPSPLEFQADEGEPTAPALAAAYVCDGLDERPLGELSIAELVDRFTVSLQRAAERAEVAIQAETAAEELPARYVPDLGVEAVEAPRLESSPAIDTPHEAVPAALRPVALDDEPLDDDDDEDFALTLALPPAADFEIEEGDAAPIEGAYSSLLTIRKPESPREFVRIEDDEAGDDVVEPVVIFPGQEEHRAGPAASSVSAERPFDAPARLRAAPGVGVGEALPVDQGQAERALREALHKLQRLSGAA